MSIDFYTGTPGSGKSYHCAIEIYNAIRNGKNVIGNIEVNTSAIPPKGNQLKGDYIFINNEEWLNNSIREMKKDKNGKIRLVQANDVFSCVQGLRGYAFNFHERNKKGQFKLHQTLLVLDECSDLFNSRSWNRSDRLTWISFFRQHRKLGYDCILISQDDKSIDKQIRSILETQYLHRNISNYKKMGKMLSFPFGGNLFVTIKSQYGYSKKDAKTGSKFIYGSNKYFDIYDTTQLF